MQTRDNPDLAGHTEPAYIWPLTFAQLDAMAHALWPHAAVVEDWPLQDDSTMPVYVDGSYAGDALQLVGLVGLGVYP